MDTQLKGAQGEAKVISELTDKGWAVAKPILDLGVDLLACKIVDDAIRTVAIQVKTEMKPNHHGGTCYGHHFTKSEIIDGVYYVIACPTIQEYIILPSEEAKQKTHWHKENVEWDNFKNKWELIR